MRILRLSMILLLLLGGPPGTATTYEDEVIKGMLRDDLVGEIIWLHAGGTLFPALLTGGQNNQSGRAAILLHSMGSHADWPEIISPLRTAMPSRGWAVLSVQLPVLSPGVSPAEYGSTFNEAGARIRSAVKFLLDRHVQDIVIIGYSFGASQAVDYLAGRDSAIKALVGISMQQQPFLKPAFKLYSALGKIDLPVLDIYGSRDYPAVIRQAADRRLAMSSNGNPRFRQVSITGADHYFTGMNDELAMQILEWLEDIVPADAGAWQPFYFPG